MWPTSTVRSGSKECGKTANPFAKRGDGPRLARSVMAKQDHGFILLLSQLPYGSGRPAITPHPSCQKHLRLSSFRKDCPHSHSRLLRVMLHSAARTASV